MNEELQKELLAILRAMKDGAPVAWQELVAQRSSYCLTLGILDTLASVALLFVSWQLSRIARRIGKRPGSDPDDWVAPAAFAVVAFVLGAFWFFRVSVPAIAEGIAPLGRMLEVIR